jgi:hypothetical protein
LDVTGGMLCILAIEMISDTSVLFLIDVLVGFGIALISILVLYFSVLQFILRPHG